MSAALTVRLTADAMPGQFDRLSKALVEIANRLVEGGDVFLDRAVRLIEAGAALDLDVTPAVGTNEHRVSLKATDALLELVRTVGAGDGELRAIEEALRHDDSPSSVVGTPTMGRVGEGG